MARLPVNSMSALQLRGEHQLLLEDSTSRSGRSCCSRRRGSSGSGKSCHAGGEGVAQE